MATIQENLQKIINSKAAIKNSINAKGGTITDSTPLDEYSTAIDNLPSGGSDPFFEFYDPLPDSIANPFVAIKKVTVPSSTTATQFQNNVDYWLCYDKGGGNAASGNVQILDLSNMSGYMTTIPAGMFSNTKITTLIGVDFSHVTSIGESAFWQANNFDIDLLFNNGFSFNNITSIGTGGLNEIGQNVNKTWELIAPNCTKLGGVYQRNLSYCNVTKVHTNTDKIYGGTRDFSGCTYLTEIIFGPRLSNLNIDSGTFGGYSSSYPSVLTTITFKSTTPPKMASADTFLAEAFPQLTHIYVPSASVSAYQAATNWLNYASIISADPNE